MSAAAADWDGINDVNALKALLAAQQEQLQKLQGPAQQAAPVNNTAGQKAARKRTATQLHGDECSDFSEELEDEAGAVQADDEEYDPANDSDYDVAPKKQKSASKSSNKKSTAGGSSKKRRAADRDTDDSDDDAPAASSAQVAKSAATALRSIRTSITSQMVYRPSLKHGTSRVSLELPCLSMAVVSHMLGPYLLSKASNGKKQLQLKADRDDLDDMFADGSHWRRCFSKSLRYGSTLGLVNGLTLTYNKSTETLKVHGSYTMNR